MISSPGFPDVIPPERVLPGADDHEEDKIVLFSLFGSQGLTKLVRLVDAEVVLSVEKLWGGYSSSYKSDVLCRGQSC